MIRASIAFAKDWPTMHFVFYPKHEFGCREVDHCPHLGGASLGSLVDAADQQTDWTDSLLRQIDGLRADSTAKSEKIQELTARVELLERELKVERQKQFKSKKEEANQDDPLEAASSQEKKRGAPRGHPGWYRQRPAAFDRLVLVPVPPRCPHCGEAVKARPDRPVYNHLQEDWIDGRRVMVCYRHEAGRCRKCRRWVRQAGLGELLRAMIGPNLRAASLFLQYDIGLTTRKVVRAVAGLAQFAFAPGSLLRFGKEAARKAKPLAQDIAEKLRACEANHADETYYRVAAKPAYVWFHGNEDLAHFCIMGTRSGQVSRTILGDDYRGGLITDCYSGYDRHRTPLKQKCLSHLKRAAEDWCKRLPKDAGHSRTFFAAVMLWVKRGCAWYRAWRNSTRPAQDPEAHWLRQELDRLEKMPTDSDRAARLQKRLRRYHGEWLMFLDHPNIPPTNNLAEQAVRALVILRKLTFGSRTRAGAKRLGTLLTVIETAKRQGKSSLKFLAALFTMSSNEACRAMYARA
jgi:transposase